MGTGAVTLRLQKKPPEFTAVEFTGHNLQEVHDGLVKCHYFVCPRIVTEMGESPRMEISHRGEIICVRIGQFVFYDGETLRVVSRDWIEYRYNVVSWTRE